MSADTPAELLRNLAATAREQVDADWAAVWVFNRRAARYGLEVAVPRGLFEPAPEKAGARGDLLAETVARKRPVVLRGGEIGDEALLHLAAADRPPVAEVFCIAFEWDRDRTGLLELIREKPSPAEAGEGQLDYLTAAPAVVSSIAASIRRFHTRREKQLGVINRLTQLYDVSRVFHSTLEQEVLLPAIADRIRVIFEGAGCRIWLPVEDGNGVLCVFPEEVEATFPTEEGDGVPWQCVQQRESILIADVAASDEPVLTAAAEGLPGSILCAPLVIEDNCLGAIEVVREPGGERFTEDDRDFMEDLCGQAAAALRNANLFHAERKAEELGALLEVSREITSTLDLDRVLMTIVNRAGSIVPAERCAILLAEGSHTELRAVSEKMEVDRADPHIRALEDVLTWTYLSKQAVYVSELEGEIEADREETREKFKRYFDQCGMKTFVALPLQDEAGLVGILSIESSEPYFVTPEQLEVFNILVSQATVAIRNAFLYHQIPLINIMEPVAGLKARLKQMPRWKWMRNGAVAAAVLAALILIPWNMKVGGKVLVLPAKNSIVTAEVEGVVEEVFQREGGRVARGEALARLEAEDYWVELEEARAKHDIANRDVARHEARLDLAAAGQARTRREQARQELELLQHRLDQTVLKSPVDGIVITPRIEQKVGLYLERGVEFCRVADMGEIVVEIRVPEAEVAEIRDGQRVRLKIDSFPTEIYYAEVEIVGQRVVEENRSRFLTVRATVDGDDLPLKTGMRGRAKIEVGPRSIGYVLFRKPARFFFRVGWSWMP
jgi:RND family efflux transporter MFP subunit